MLNAESNRLEYKRELNDKLERSVVAFLNTSEGGCFISALKTMASLLAFPISTWFRDRLLTESKTVFRRPRLGFMMSPLRRLTE
jgi:hypothetical protein